jgi:hypothetical protein
MTRAALIAELSALPPHSRKRPGIEYQLRLLTRAELRENLTLEIMAAELAAAVEMEFETNEWRIA